MVTASPSAVPTRFIAIVGPSGVGKDSLIDAVRRRYGEDGPVRVVRRAITRPAAAGGEDHEALSEPDFLDRIANGDFVLHWQAHGLFYGIPADVQESLMAGKAVIANLSRAVLDQVRTCFPERRIILVTAPAHILAERLAGRGRETASDISARLRRSTQDMPKGPDVIEVVNDGPLDKAAAALFEAIES